MPKPPGSNRSDRDAASSMTVASPIGVIGLGLMGAALSARLIDAGIAVVGFDIDAARCGAFAARGGEVAVSATALAARCRIVIVAVLSGGQVERLLAALGKSQHPAQGVMICTTTCAPDEIMAIAKCAAAAGLSLVEAPISGTSAEARDGSAMGLIAGPPEAIDAADAVLDILCPQRANVGQVGDASRTKLAINLILQNNRAALAEGLVFAESLGLDPAVFLAAARKSAAYSAVMDSKGQKMLMRDFAAQSHISQTLKDAELILDEAKRRDLHLPVTSTQVSLLRRAIALCGPESDSAAVIEAIRPSRAQTGDAT
jgi:3-hydroxyisobutyrate dehydrogenase-like beta-hydroxyacid dehydrogenase